MLLNTLNQGTPLHRREISREDPGTKKMETVRADEEMLTDRGCLFMDSLAKSWVSFNKAVAAHRCLAPPFGAATGAAGTAPGPGL